MRIRALFITAVMGLAVVSGICKGLTSPRSGAKKEGEGKAAKKEERSGEKADI